MNIAIKTIADKMTELLESKGYAESDIPFIIEMYLGGELRGHTSHGLASFPSFIKEDFSGLDEPEVVKETEALFMIDAKSNPGVIVGKRAADEALERSKKQVVGISSIKNMDSWLRPGAIAEYIAEQGFVGLVINSGGGAAIAPPGGFDPVTGTNPIAYGVPTEQGSLVVDMASSKRAWGQVRLANKYGTDLPADSFYDDEGNITVDPKKAWSALPFGEYKGFSLALFVEMMCGSLIGMDMMIDSKGGNKFGEKMPDRGALIIVIDPSQTVGLDEFKQRNTSYLAKIKSSRPRNGEKIRIPGEEAVSSRAQKLADGHIDLPESLWEEISLL